MKQYIVDAFTDKVFSGNSAAVCILDKWISEELMQCITSENNLSETAFAVKDGDESYSLRWFTPCGEIDLCGHATLGTAYVIMNFYEKESKHITFHTMSGDLTVKRNKDIYEMDFPAYELKDIPITQVMSDAISIKPVKAFIRRDLLLVLGSEDEVYNTNPDFNKIKELDGLLLHITAQGTEYDCVSRSFAPKLNVEEDPVCGSEHCHIVPYWCNEKTKNKS